MAAPPPILITSMSQMSLRFALRRVPSPPYPPGPEGTPSWVPGPSSRERGTGMTTFLVLREGATGGHISVVALDGMQAGELEGGCLGESAADVEGLHGLAGRAFHQVVEGGHDDDAVGIGIALEADVTPVGAGEELRLRIAMDAG